MRLIVLTGPETELGSCTLFAQACMRGLNIEEVEDFDMALHRRRQADPPDFLVVAGTDEETAKRHFDDCKILGCGTDVAYLAPKMFE